MIEVNERKIKLRTSDIIAVCEDNETNSLTFSIPLSSSTYDLKTLTPFIVYQPFNVSGVQFQVLTKTYDTNNLYLTWNINRSSTFRAGKLKIQIVLSYSSTNPTLTNVSYRWSSKICEVYIPESLIDSQYATPSEPIISQMTALVNRAETAAVAAEQKVSNMTASATGLAAGASPTATYNSNTNVMSFGIPKGDTGATGADGSKWYSGTNPNSIVDEANNGDYYLLMNYYGSFYPYDVLQLSKTESGGETVISWGRICNIKGETGSKGDKGDKGDQGNPGSSGPPGAPGYTPVRGTDYWTTSDKEEIVEDVIEEIGSIPTKTSDLTNDSGFITNSVNNLTNYYLKTSTYSKDDVNALISAVKQFTYELVSALPSASANTMNKIYLVPSSQSSTSNIKDEYITLDNGSSASPRYTWEQIGNTSIDLSDYYTKSQTDSAITNHHDSTKQNLITNDNKLSYSLISGTPDISGKENTSNKVTAISSSSTNTQYPSALAVYSYIQSLIYNGSVS